MSHFEFVAWSYGIVVFGVGGLVIYVWLNLRHQTQMLADLERQGLTRRRPVQSGS